MRNLVLVIGSALLFAAIAPAQTSTGSITGSVVDPSGQLIPGAQVTVVNENTAEQREGIANEAGDFVFPALVPGTYICQATTISPEPDFRKWPRDCEN
jgi:hypothetical protein